jgi:Fe-S cluster assembly protein SufD
MADKETTSTRQRLEWVLSSFGKWEKEMNGVSQTEIHSIRRAALKVFSAKGFPTTRDEEWRFTNVQPIAATEFVPSLQYDAEGIRQSDVDAFLFPGLRGSRLVFINGHFASEFSDCTSVPGSVRVQSLAEALRKDPELVLRHLTRLAVPEGNSFTALNTAFVQDGAFLYLPDGVEMPAAVHLLFLSVGNDKPGLHTPRNLIVAGKESKLSIVETYHTLGSGSHLTDVVTEVVAGPGTIIEHDKFQNEHPRSFHVGMTHMRLEAGSTVTSNAVTLGGAIVRNNVTVVLAGEGCEATLNGLSLATGTQLIDNHTVIDHAMPNCVSHELYKAIQDGKSRGVFNGKIFVRKDAQKTDAKQTNKTLLLSDNATMDTKPQLEIFADDVKCTHGATVGQLEEDQVFYLRTRGIDLDAARDILTFAFATDVIERVHVAPLREQLDTMLHARLHQGRITNAQ